MAKKKVKCGVGKLLDPNTGKCRKMTQSERKGVFTLTSAGAIAGGMLASRTGIPGAGIVGAAVGGYKARKKTRKLMSEGRLHGQR